MYYTSIINQDDIRLVPKTSNFIRINLIINRNKFLTTKIIKQFYEFKFINKYYVLTFKQDFILQNEKYNKYINDKLPEITVS